MLNMRIVIASTATFIALIVVWTKFVEHGHDKIMPVIEEQNERALEKQKEFKKLIQQDMAGLGAGSISETNELHPSEREAFSGAGMPVRARRPLGSWMGVRKGKENNLSLMKFDKSNYWLWVKNTAGEDLKEKGEYDFEFDVIHFKPKGKSSYYLDYYMASRDRIELSGYDYYYTLETDETVEFDF